MRRENGRPVFDSVEGAEFEVKVDLVLLAMGFLGPERAGHAFGARCDADRARHVQA